MKNIIKAILILFTLLVCLVGCVKKDEKLENWSVAVVLTSSTQNKSKILYYDSDLKLVKENDYKYSNLDMGINGPTYDNEKVYLPVRGNEGNVRKFDKIVAEVDLESGDLSEISFDRTNIQTVGKIDDYLYNGSNLNNVSYITRKDISDKSVMEIELPNMYVRTLFTSQEKVYAIVSDMSSESDKSLIIVYDKNLEHLETIDLTSLGDSNSNYIISNDSVLLAAPYDIQGNPVSRIIELNLNTNNIEAFSVDSTVEELILYEGQIFVFGYDRFDLNSKTTLSIYNASTFEKLKDIAIDKNVRRFRLVNNMLYGVSVDAEDKSNITLYCFDISDELRIKQDIKLPNYTDFYYVSQIFINK